MDEGRQLGMGGMRECECRGVGLPLGHWQLHDSGTALQFSFVFFIVTQLATEQSWEMERASNLTSELPLLVPSLE